MSLGTLGSKRKPLTKRNQTYHTTSLIDQKMNNTFGLTKLYQSFERKAKQGAWLLPRRSNLFGKPLGWVLTPPPQKLLGCPGFTKSSFWIFPSLPCRFFAGRAGRCLEGKGPHQLQEKIGQVGQWVLRRKTSTWIFLGGFQLSY